MNETLITIEDHYENSNSDALMSTLLSIFGMKFLLCYLEID